RSTRTAPADTGRGQREQEQRRARVAARAGGNLAERAVVLRYQALSAGQPREHVDRALALLVAVVHARRGAAVAPRHQHASLVVDVDVVEVEQVALAAQVV